MSHQACDHLFDLLVHDLAAFRADHFRFMLCLLLRFTFLTDRLSMDCVASSASTPRTRWTEEGIHEAHSIFHRR